MSTASKDNDSQLIALAPRLPTIVTVAVPGFRGNGYDSYTGSPFELTLFSVGVIVLLALVTAVSRLTTTAQRIWVILIPFLLTPLVAIYFVAVMVSSLYQLDRCTPIGAGLDAIVLLSTWVQPLSITMLVVVLASGLLVPRRMALGTWRPRRPTT